MSSPCNAIVSGSARDHRFSMECKRETTGVERSSPRWRGLSENWRFRGKVEVVSLKTSLFLHSKVRLQTVQTFRGLETRLPHSSTVDETNVWPLRCLHTRFVVSVGHQYTTDKRGVRCRVILESWYRFNGGRLGPGRQRSPGKEEPDRGLGRFGFVLPSKETSLFFFSLC